MVAGLPKMGLTVPAAKDGDPKTGVALVVSDELLLLPPNVNADVVDSAGFDAVVVATAPPKLNPEEPVAVVLPKIELPAAGELAVAADAAAPNVPNVGLSADAAAPKVGTTLLVD